MIDSARESFAAESEVRETEIVELMEINMKNLLATGTIDLADFLARADILAAAGKTVLISGYFEYYRLAGYLTRYTSEPIALTMGLSSLEELFDERYYTELKGGILEAFGKLFTKDLRIYIYPLLVTGSGDLKTAHDFELPATLQSLYQHLVERGRIRQLENFDRTVLHIFSRDVLHRIQANDQSWEEMVPPAIAEVIKQRRFFGSCPAEGLVSHAHR